MNFFFNNYIFFSWQDDTVPCTSCSSQLLIFPNAALG